MYALSRLTHLRREKELQVSESEENDRWKLHTSKKHVLRYEKSYRELLARKNN